MMVALIPLLFNVQTSHKTISFAFHFFNNECQNKYQLLLG